MIKSENMFYCPNCHYNYEDIQDYGFDSADTDGNFDMVCEECYKEFKVKFKTVIYFETK